MLTVLEYLGCFYGFIGVYAAIGLAGEWIADRLESWQARRIAS